MFNNAFSCNLSCNMCFFSRRRGSIIVTCIQKEQQREKKGNQREQKVKMSS